MNDQSITRDERTVVVENTSFRLAPWKPWFFQYRIAKYCTIKMRSVRSCPTRCLIFFLST